MIKKIQGYLRTFILTIIVVKIWEYLILKKGREYERAKQYEEIVKATEKQKKALDKGNYINNRNKLRKRVHNKTY